MPHLVQPLLSGPLDLIGDIHGEIRALEALMQRLGYDRSGGHRDGRHLVFVGDFIDRGEDSPAAIERVSGLVMSGVAQAVLGNHELNLLLAKRKEGNGWYYDEDHDHAAGQFIDVPRASGSQRANMLDFLETLPLALERDDLRVVHACWWPEAIGFLRNETQRVADVFRAHKERVDADLRQSGLIQGRAAEYAEWGLALRDRSAAVPFLPAIAAVDSARQSAHPIKVVTSGLETPARAPFFASGKWRMTERAAWWNDYDESPAVVMGHYWRWPGDESEAAARSRGPNLFDGTQPPDWLGPRGNVMCIDWCAGLRWRERIEGVSNFSGRLGALRWPEREILFDR